MKKQLFKDASLRLAATYLLVVMAVSAVFSVTLYRVLRVDIDRHYNQSLNLVQEIGDFRIDPMQRRMYMQGRQDDREVSRNRLINELLIINLIIFVFGGALCYYLARQTLKPIEEAHEALERFTSDASHELRTPLTTMRTEIEVALMNDKLTAKEARALLGSNLEEVDRLTHLSERLLMIARLEEGNIPFEHVTLSKVIDKAVDVIEPAANKKRITIEQKTTKTQSMAVNGDMSSLTELVVILLDNAVKYSDSNTKTTIKVVQEGKKAVLSVIDQGMGIAAEDVQHIFDRFYQADTARSGGETRGYGLGLSLAQKITQLHNGTITVSSKPGKGSTFTVTLPLV